MQTNTPLGGKSAMFLYLPKNSGQEGGQTVQ